MNAVAFFSPVDPGLHGDRLPVYFHNASVDRVLWLLSGVVSGADLIAHIETGGKPVGVSEIQAQAFAVGVCCQGLMDGPCMPPTVEPVQYPVKGLVMDTAPMPLSEKNLDEMGEFMCQNVNGQSGGGQDPAEISPGFDLLPATPPAGQSWTVEKVSNAAAADCDRVPVPEMCVIRPPARADTELEADLRLALTSPGHTGTPQMSVSETAETFRDFARHLPIHV